jgi:hypothetical protein
MRIKMRSAARLDISLSGRLLGGPRQPFAKNNPTGRGSPVASCLTSGVVNADGHEAPLVTADMEHGAVLQRYKLHHIELNSPVRLFWQCAELCGCRDPSLTFFTVRAHSSFRVL